MLHCYIALRGSVATHQLRVAHTLGKTSMLECSRGDEDDSDDLLVIMTLLGSEEKPISNLRLHNLSHFRVETPVIIMVNL